MATNKGQTGSSAAVSKISAKGDPSSASATGTPGNNVAATRIIKGGSASKYGG
jgi:hypothetical protein